jgi:hypothetical protein
MSANARMGLIAAMIAVVVIGVPLTLLIVIANKQANVATVQAGNRPSIAVREVGKSRGSGEYALPRTAPNEEKGAKVFQALIGLVCFGCHFPLAVFGVCYFKQCPGMRESFGSSWFAPLVQLDF